MEDFFGTNGRWEEPRKEEASIWTTGSCRQPADQGRGLRFRSPSRGERWPGNILHHSTQPHNQQGAELVSAMDICPRPSTQQTEHTTTNVFRSSNKTAVSFTYFFVAIAYTLMLSLCNQLEYIYA